MLVFSVTPFKLNKNQNHSIDEVQILRKERRLICKDSRQVSGHSNFSYARYAEKLFTQIYRDLYGANAGAHPDGHQHGGRKPIETSVLEFCYKSVNLSLEKLKNIKVILFCNTRTVQVAKFPEISPEISHFLTNSAVMQMKIKGKEEKAKK